MTEDDPLLAAVLADPRDDLHRLRYADWLEDNSQPVRAGFIRDQLAWEGLDAHPDRDGSVWCKNCLRWVYGCKPTLRCRGLVCSNARRQRDALARYRSEWKAAALAPVMDLHAAWIRHEVMPRTYPRPAQSHPYSWPFRPDAVAFHRGFAAMIALPLSAWLEHGPDLLRTAPWEWVGATDRDPHYDEDDEQYHWWQVDPDGDPDVPWESELPAGLIPLLMAQPGQGGRFAPTYPTTAAARDALSAALLAWARAG